MHKITKNVLLGTKMRGCNTGAVVTSAGVVVIDTPMVPKEARSWRREVEQYDEIKYVINNEHHLDHSAGSCWMGGTLVASEGNRRAMTQRSVQMLKSQLKWLAPDALPLDKDFRYRLPDITFNENLTLYLGKHSFHILDMPGHTPFMTAVYIPEEKVVFTSDNLIWEMPIMFEATPVDWLESLDKIEMLDVNKIVPGHGDVCDKSRINIMRDNINYIVDSVQEGIDKGWGVKEIQERVPFADRFSLDWGDLKDLLNHGIAHLYELLTKHK